MERALRFALVVWALAYAVGCERGPVTGAEPERDRGEHDHEHESEPTPVASGGDSGLDVGADGGYDWQLPSAAEREDVLAFLESLTDPEFLANREFGDPWARGD